MNALRTPLLILLLLCAVGANALSVSISVYNQSNCGQGNGSMAAYASGGTPPYTYVWSNGGTGASNYGIGPGTYTVTVTDALLDQATAEATINSLPTIQADSYEGYGMYCSPELPFVFYYAGTENGMPPNPSTGSMHTPGPYSFDAVGYSESWQQIQEGCGGIYSYYLVSIDGAPVGTNVTVNFTDGAGCPGTFHTIIQPPVVFPAMQVINTTGSCSNGNIGSVTIWKASTSQQLSLRMRNSAGQFVPDDCTSAWMDQGNNTYTHTGLAPGTYHAVLDVDQYNLFANGMSCTDSLEIIIPDLGTQCGQVNGRVYVDGNANCAYNSGENLVPTVIEVNPGPHYTLTNSNGQYNITLPFGTYTFTEQHPVLVQSCPVEATVSAGTVQNNNIGCAAGTALDVQLMMSNGPARPGFELHYDITVDNLTPSPTGTVTLTMDFDPALGFISASPTPTSVVGNTITWTDPSFTMTNAFQHKTVDVRFQIPPDINLIGTTLTTTATIVTTETDADLANNTVNSAQIVTASFDPNEKVAVTSTQNDQAIYFIDQDEWIDYTIRFQNTGTDTAFNVVITDTLPASLDPGTVQWGPSSHACTRSLTGAGIAKAIFTNIQLPDSNVNEAASHGFVSFRIRPRLPLTAGAQIANTANIYFDYNPPVITETSVLTAEFSTGVQAVKAKGANVYPNPATDRIHMACAECGSAPYEVTIFALDGRTVLQTKLLSEAEGINMATLANGTYLLRATGAKGSSITPFIKASHP